MVGPEFLISEKDTGEIGGELQVQIGKRRWRHENRHWNGRTYKTRPDGTRVFFTKTVLKQMGHTIERHHLAKAKIKQLDVEQPMDTSTISGPHADQPLPRNPNDILIHYDIPPSDPTNTIK